MGDGQQMIIDVVGAGGVLLFACIAYFYAEKQRELPNSLSLLWGVTIFYFIARTLFSDDIGYSVYSLMRFIDSFIIFYVFYCYRKNKDQTTVLWYILGFVLVSLVLSTIYVSVPALTLSLPKTNLLVPTYGHNNIVDILLFGLPIALMALIFKRNLVSIGVFLMIIIGIVFSFSRAAMLLSAFFIMVASIPVKHFLSRKIKILLFLLSLCVVSAMGILILFPQTRYAQYFSPSFLPKMAKQTSGVGARLEYFNQAITAIRERPFFGSGPGTFYLQSMRLQSTYGTYSRYAHNVLLHEITEVGIIGVFLESFIILWCFFHLIRALRKGTTKPKLVYVTLASIGVLQLSNAMIDFSMNFFVIQMLSVFILSIMATAGESSESTQVSKPRFLFAGSIFLVFIFYITTSLCAMYPHKKIPFLYSCCLLSEFSSSTALEKTSNELTASELSDIHAFHKKNPIVLLSIARYYKTNMNEDLSKQYFRRALAYNPKNFPIYKAYILSLLEDKDTDELEHTLLLLFQHFSLQDLKTEIQYNYFFKPHLTQTDMMEIIALIPDGTMTSAKLSQIFYAFGYIRINLDTDLTEYLWSLAARTYPDTGFYYQELASLDYFFNKNKDAAIAHINQCKQNNHAWEHCRQIHVPSLDNLTYPGENRNLIFELK